MTRIPNKTGTYGGGSSVTSKSSANEAKGVVVRNVMQPASKLCFRLELLSFGTIIDVSEMIGRCCSLTLLIENEDLVCEVPFEMELLRRFKFPSENDVALEQKMHKNAAMILNDLAIVSVAILGKVSFAMIHAMLHTYCTDY